ncbi:MAG: gliding motility-associated ABC transporter substrate-binding protein GldG [Saprospiraceae bacterium]|nr:gliding motility-associated ABC transporter substrate-binding protein GldG [Saprospiraceae bacterium]
MALFKNIKNFAGLLVLAGILILVNVISSYLYGSIDLTEEKRFTLTPATKKILKELPEVVFVRVLLEGEFPSGFKRLQQSTIEMLDQFASVSGYVEYQFEDPNDGTVEEINAKREELKKEGLLPTNLFVRSGTENKEQIIYPYAIFNYGERKVAVNLLENSADQDQDAKLSNSIGLLEYKFANAIQKLKYKDRKNIVLTTGNGELETEYTKSLMGLLYPFYNVGRIHLDSVAKINSEIDLVIVARPTQKFEEKNKFKLDQFLMNGGKAMFFLDGIAMSLDSLGERNEYIPEVLDVNLGDQLFEYGVRIEPNLVLDLECSRIPQVIGRQGGKPQIELFPWYYHPLIASKDHHPITNHIDRVNLEFVSTIDTLKTKYPVRKTILLNSSQYSRYQLAPMKIGFDILRYKPEPEKFNKPYLPVAVLLEGEFSSLYENRVTEEMMNNLAALQMEFKSKSKPTSIIVVGDGDLPKNLYDEETGKTAPMGYSRWEKLTFEGNKDFILNAVEYLIDPNQVLAARSKQYKLRLLDKVKAEKEKTFWQFFNVGIPIFLLILFGVFNHYSRKRKYIKI